MKTLLKILLVVVVVVVVIAKCNNQLSEEVEKEEEKTFWEENPGMKDKKFQELKSAEKQIFLEQLIAGEFEPFRTWGLKVEMGLEEVIARNVKYPETIKYKTISGWGDYAGIVRNSQIEDIEKGVLVATGEFKSENKLGMEVKGSYSVKYKIEGESFVVVDLQLE